jgi:hypothetical protein
LLSILILNNFSDIGDVVHFGKSFQGGRACFNNVQQYIVPDVQMNQLKRALKKIVQNVTSSSGKLFEDSLKEPTSPLSPIDGKVDALGKVLIDQANFGVLLLLGKLYFHCCKFKQSIYCLELAKI